MIVKIIETNNDYKTATACMASNWLDGKKERARIVVHWNNASFSPKKGHSYSVRPCHEWVKSRRGMDLVHGFMDDEKSMEEKLSESYSRKN